MVLLASLAAWFKNCNHLFLLSPKKNVICCQCVAYICSSLKNSNHYIISDLKSLRDYTATLLCEAVLSAKC